MDSRNKISFSMVCLALVITVLASQHETASAQKASPFCAGLPPTQIPFCTQALQGEPAWDKAITKIIQATIQKVITAQPAAATIEAKLPATIPAADKATIAEKCKSGHNYAIENLHRSEKRIREGVYERTNDVVYTAWAGIYECSGALEHFQVNMNVEPFKTQDATEKAVGACHSAVSKALFAGGKMVTDEHDDD